MADPPTLRRLGADDLVAYKALRDATLAAHEDAFTSDAESEARKVPSDYRSRFGLDRIDAGQFTVGAFVGARLVGALSCEREPRRKVRHLGHVVGMMVEPGHRRRGVGRALLQDCIGRARLAPGLEILTLSVTAGNPAERLYEGFGFVRYGVLRHALKIDHAYHDKHLMSLAL
jgi:ribosomal protein S18 acetylase RimI-like enzyme